MIDSKKQYQGQRGCEARPTCPVCGEILQIAYIRKTVNGKRAYVPVGYSCPSDTCAHIEKSKPENIEGQ